MRGHAERLVELEHVDAPPQLLWRALELGVQRDELCRPAMRPVVGEDMREMQLGSGPQRTAAGRFLLSARAAAIKRNGGEYDIPQVCAPMKWHCAGCVPTRLASPFAARVERTVQGVPKLGRKR